MEKFAAITELESCTELVQTELQFWFRGEFPISDFQNRIREKWGHQADHGEWHTSMYSIFRFTHHDIISDVLCEVDHNGDIHNIRYGCMSGFLWPIFYQSVWKWGLPLHAALIERNGKGLLLAGSGRTGKSTSCQRIPSPWIPICDDGVLVLLDKEKKYRVHPTPTWSEYTMKRSEKTWNIQHSVPLSAIFILEQADTDEVIPVGSGRAAIVVNQSAIQSCGTFWTRMPADHQKAIRKRIFDSACELAERVPTFRLRATLHGRFWEEMEKVI